MRILNAFDYLNRENTFLKLTASFIVFVSTSMIVLSLWLVLKPPLVVERSCHSKILELKEQNPTEGEIESFLKDAMDQRFNSGFESSNLLSKSQLSFREAEQSELSKANMSQTIVVRKVASENGQFVVDADRLIAIGNLRSAFKFNVRTKLHQVMRSGENPYGLILDEAEPIKEIKR